MTGALDALHVSNPVSPTERNGPDLRKRRVRGRSLEVRVAYVSDRAPAERNMTATTIVIEVLVLEPTSDPV